MPVLHFHGTQKSANPQYEFAVIANDFVIHFAQIKFAMLAAKELLAWNGDRLLIPFAISLRL